MTKNKKSLELIDKVLEELCTALGHVEGRLDDIGYAGIKCSPKRKKAIEAASLMLSTAADLVDGAFQTLKE